MVAKKKALAGPERTRGSARPARKRGIGRPRRDAAAAVGREVLVDCVCQLLRTHAPHAITYVSVARKAGVDPSLVRYYFKDRHELLVAATERLASLFDSTLSVAHIDPSKAPLEAILARASALLKLEVTYPFFNRLIVEEVVSSRLANAQALMEKFARRAIEACRRAIDTGVQQGRMRPVNPLFLHLAMIGICSMYVTGQPIMEFAVRKGIAGGASAEEYEHFLIDLLRAGLTRATD